MCGGVGTRRDGHIGGVDFPRLVVAGEVVQLPFCTDIVSYALGHVFLHRVAGGFVERRLGRRQWGGGSRGQQKAAMHECESKAIEVGNRARARTRASTRVESKNKSIRADM